MGYSLWTIPLRYSGREVAIQISRKTRRVYNTETTAEGTATTNAKGN